MAGPTLQLGVNAAGQDTIAGLNQQLAQLRTNLGALKAAKADLSGLDNALTSLQRFRTEFASTEQTLRAAFAELAGTISSGFKAVAEATQAGGQISRSAAQQTRTQLQSEYGKAVTDRKSFTDAEVNAIRAGGARLIAADEQVLAARAAAAAAARAQPAAGPVVFAPAASRAPQLAQLEAESARFIETQLRLAAEEEAGQRVAGARILAGAAQLTAALRTAAAEESAARTAWLQATQAGVSEMVSAGRAAMRREDEMRASWAARILTGAAKLAEARARASAIESASQGVAPTIQVPGAIAVPDGSAAIAALQALRSAFATADEALRASTADLAAAVRQGMVLVAEEVAAGGARVIGAAQQTRAALQVEFDRSIAARQRFTQAEIEQVRSAGTKLAAAEREAQSARTAVLANAVLPTPTAAVQPGAVSRAPQIAAMEAESSRFVAAQTELAGQEEQAKILWASRLLTASARFVEAIAKAASMEATATLAWIAATEANTARLVAAQTAAARAEDGARAGWIAKILSGARQLAEARVKAVGIEGAVRAAAPVVAPAPAVTQAPIAPLTPQTVTVPQPIIKPAAPVTVPAPAITISPIAALKDQQQALKTQMAELTETVKTGGSAMADAIVVNGRTVRGLRAQELASMQAVYEREFREGIRQNEVALQQAKAFGVKLMAADAEILRVRAAANATNKVALGGGEFRNPPFVPPPSAAPETEIGAAYAQHQRQMAQQAAAARASEWTRAQFEADEKIAQAQAGGFKMWAAKEKELSAARVAEATSLAKIERAGIAAAYANAAIPNSTRPASPLQVSDRTNTAPVFAARADASFKAEADRIAAEKISAWVQAESSVQKRIEEVEMQTAQGFTRIARLALAEKLRAVKETDAALAAAMLENDAFVRAVEVQAAKDVAAIRAAAEKVKIAEAAYQARSPQQQIQTQVRARAAIDTGIDTARVEQSFGSSAMAAAQAATSLDALKKAHAEVGNSAAGATPKVAGMKNAMNDLHSAARGVASGFDAMFLTWGSIAPLLAGAAFAHAFVQTVKQGSEVYQTLEVIKQLSDETDSSINMLKNTLLDLASNGPQGPKEIADAMKALSLAGLNAAEVAASVKSALTLSIVGEMPAQKAAESLVAISTAYGYAAGDFNRVNDVIAKTAAVSMSSVEGMTSSFRVASVVAQQYGVRLEDTATQLGLLANIGIRNQQGGTAVTQFYSGLAAGTQKGHDALTKIIGDVRNLRDETTGNFKPLPDIMELLNKGLARYKAIDQGTLVSAVFNNRAARDAFSNLQATRTPAYDPTTGKVMVDDAGKVISKMDEMAKKVTESYGFAAIAMANLSLTASNQMKSVMAALQGSFVSVFESLEPTILVVSEQLRRAFNSGDFKSTLTGLAGSVANLTVFLIEHANWLKIAAEAWLIFKAASIGAALFSGAVTGLTALAGAFAAVTSAAPLAAGGMVALRAAMGPIGFILTALAGAWAIYQVTSTKASTTAADIASLKGRQIIEALDKESERLEARNKLILSGVSAREADIRLAAIQAQQDMAKDSSKVRNESQGRIDSAQTELADLRAEAAKLNSGKGGYNTEGTRKQFADAIAAAENRVVDAKAQQNLASRDQLRMQELMTTAVARQVAAAKEAATVSPPTRPSLGTGGTEDYTKTKDHSVQAANDTLARLKAVYAATEAELKKYYDQTSKIEDIRHKSGQVSDIQYQIETQSREQIYFSQRLNNLQNFIDDSADKLEVLKNAGKNRDQRAIGEEEKEQIRLRSLKSELVLAQQIAEEQQKASVFTRGEDLNKFISQRMQEVVLDREVLATRQQMSVLTSDQRAVEEARLAAASKFTDEIRKTNVELAKAQQYLTELKTGGNKSAANDFGAGDTGKIASTQEAVDRLQGSVTRLQESGATAGQYAAETMVERLKPQWQLMLDGWRNVTEGMKVAYDEIVDGFLQRGQDIFTRLLKTGKLTASELIDVMVDTVSKQIYQQTIAPGIAQLGQFAATTLFGERPQATGTLNPVDIAAQKTALSLTTMNDFAVNPMTGAMGRLILAVDQAASAMLRIGVNGGFSTPSLQGLFGNNTGDGSAGFTGNGGFGDTTGDVGGQIVHLFAKGSAFTNKVFNERTPFHFADGAGFSRGEMAEVGPEAVMPLARGADGSLGVVNHGGGQQAGVVVVVENHSGVPTRQQETTRSDGRREVRVIIDQMKSELINDVHSGGEFAGAIEGQYGVNRASGLSRR